MPINVKATQSELLPIQETKSLLVEDTNWRWGPSFHIQHIHKEHLSDSRLHVLCLSCVCAKNGRDENQPSRSPLLVCSSFIPPPPRTSAQPPNFFLAPPRRGAEQMRLTFGGRRVRWQLCIQSHPYASFAFCVRRRGEDCVSSRCVVSISRRLVCPHYSFPLTFHLFFGPAFISVSEVTTGAGDKRTVSEVSDLCLCANRRAVAARKVQESPSENNTSGA